MGLKIFTVAFAKMSADPYLRNDVKYHNFLNHLGWNIFESKGKKMIALKDILEDDYNLFVYDDDEQYKGIPTGQGYLGANGEIIDFLDVTAEDHPDRLKYKVSNDNILISSLRLARSPALLFENQDLSQYVFSNGFYIFKVKSGWNKKFILYVLRCHKIRNIIDNYIYRGIGISAYKKEDLLKVKIPLLSKSEQEQIVAKIEPIEKEIKQIQEEIISKKDEAIEIFCKGI